MSEDFEALKKRIALACRIAYLEGLKEDKGNEIAGHISVRTGSTLLMPGHMHDKGKGLPDITSADIIEVDMDGNRVKGNLDPVEEVVIHTFIYRARPEINCVTHLHAPTATALASTDETILPISIRSSYFAEGLPILHRGPGIIDNEEIASEMISAMGNHNALIHKGHGIMTAGRNMEEACTLAIFLEGSARNQLLAKQLGNLKPFEKRYAIEYAKSHSLDKRKYIWLSYENKWKDIKV
ncbi:MAG TPA: class II aldolase/adducin family protein [Nitrososphaerales archaeon]|nr:class II aldolase/adducin family protein [Nitrososphaerales archaeon]